MLTSRCCACGYVRQIYVTRKAGKNSTAGVNKVTELTGSFRCPKRLVGCDGDLFTLDRQDDGSHVVCRLDDTSTGRMNPVFSVDEDCTTLRATRNHELLLVCAHQLVLLDLTGDPVRVVTNSNMKQRGYTFGNALQLPDGMWRHCIFHRLSKANSANALVAMTRPTARLKSKTIFSCL